MPALFQSRKFQASAFATLLVGVQLVFTETDPGLTRLEKRNAAIEFVQTLGWVWGVSIGAQGLEDAAMKFNPVGGTATAPQVQVNTGTDSNPVQTTTNASTAPQSPAIPPVADGAASAFHSKLKDGTPVFVVPLAPAPAIVASANPLLAAHQAVVLPPADQKKAT